MGELVVRPVLHLIIILYKIRQQVYMREQKLKVDVEGAVEEAVRMLK